MPRQHFGNDYAGSSPENYQRYFVPAIGAPLAASLIRQADLHSGERVLDVACGTGIVTRLAVEQVGDTGTIAGLDPNPGMLAVARSVTPTGTGIEWHQAGAEKMPLSDESFDVVLCQMGLQFVPDKDAALREMYRVLVPGGRLVINLPGPTPRPFTVLEKAFAKHIGAEPAGFVNQVFSLSDTDEIKRLAVDAGFDDVAVRAETGELTLPAPAEFLWQYVHSTPLAGVVARVDGERLDALERDVAAAWQEFVEDGALMLRLRMVTATGRK